MEPRQEHLSDAQIEQCAKLPPGSCPGQVEFHLSECEHCLESLLKRQRIHLQRFEVKGMRQEPDSKCPADSKIKEVAAGMADAEAAAETLQHAAHCDHCGPLLSQYLEVFSEESSPEIEALIDQLPSSKPGWEKNKAHEIAVEIRRSKEADLSSKPVPSWWQLVMRPHILAAAGGLASLTIAAIFWGPPAVGALQLANAKKLFAKAYVEDRVTEMRFVGVPYADYRPIEGKMGIDGAEELRHPALMKALTNLSGIPKSHKDDPRWLQMEGRLLLLKNPASKEAETSFLKAQAKEPNDPNLEIDLAVSDFERDSRNSKPEQIPNLSNSINRLEKMRRDSQLTREQKAVVLFNLAVAYEKSKSCPQAKDMWDKYLEIDHNSPWSNEARLRLEENKKCVSQSEGSLPDTSDAAFFWDHLANPAVQQNAEEYFPSAVSWLPNAIRQPGSRPSQAYTALADLLKEKHSDGMLSDLFAALTLDEMPAVLALGAALQANQQSNSAEAIKNARSAYGLFAKSHNIAGELWARYSEVYAYQRKQSGIDCLDAIAGLEPRLDRTSYHWLQGHLALEKAICRKQAGILDEKKTNADLSASKKIDEQFSFPILRFRRLGIAPGLQRLISSTCEASWGEELKGLEEYWKSTYPWERLYQFYSVLEQCAEDEQHWYQAKALMDFMIEMRIQKDKLDPDLNVLSMLYIHAAKINTALRDYAGAEDAARHAKATSDKAPGPHQYEPVANIILAECQLKRRNAEEALKILTAVADISADDDLLDFYRVKGNAHLQLNQLDKAEEEFERGVIIAERSLATATVVKQRIEWAAKTEELYRGLVQIWLQQKRTDDALRLWEWSKTRSAYAQYASGSYVPAATSRKKLDWKMLERHIPMLPVSLEPGTHLIYAVFNNRLHVWTIDQGQIRSNWIEVGDEKLEKLIDDFDRKCADGSSSLEELQQQGEMLFALLIQPFVRDFSKEQTVVIEPDQQLWRLPIQALRSPDGRYMAEKSYIRYSPGILVEEKLRRAGRLDTRTLLQVEAYPGFTGKFDQILDRFIHRKVLLGANTSKTELLEEARQNDVLFFFGHAIPEGRGIVLMLNGNNLLRAVDFDPATVQRLSLAVLAACSTGSTGRYGLLDNNSLVRAFLAGGVPDVVASQWDVDNLSTADLMNRFFQNSLDGEPMAGAMIDAEREFLRLHAQDKYQHPYYWAGFMVIGRADSTPPPSRAVALR